MEADVMRKGFAGMQGLFLIEIFVWTAECDGRKTPGKHWKYLRQAQKERNDRL
ncbi:hypothetical protein HMPREF1548_06855 [Clostridium sp. KLE 1755]|jgi:hypothetical protein|nr:hypothetical protein HMPREF1548_06855 [Clostridium sp. KLE 1755]